MEQRTPSPEPVAVLSVETIMQRMVDGDPAAVFALATHHGARVAGVVRRHLRACGVDRVAKEDLDGLVLDACMVLRDVAPAWRVGGALPWWWAQGRIRSVVSAWVGVHADPLDERWAPIAGHEGAASAVTHDEPVAETFARLVVDVPLVGLVAEACRAARVDELALECLLDYSMQQHQGDPSPAHTLAARYGVTPQALRKRISRDRARLRTVVRSEARFADLADLALVA